MNNINRISNTIPSIEYWQRCSPWSGVFLVSFACICLALLPAARAVSPPPDGGYPNENTAEGDNALANVDLSGAGGFRNVALGFEALFSNTTGSYNTATGYYALGRNTTGDANTATGHYALYYNSTGNYNMATGTAALFGNTTGSSNTAGGYEALSYNTTGGVNTATGAFALSFNETGNENTAFGAAALEHTTGSGNTALGVNALVSNTTASFNNALGDGALFSNTTGAGNTGLGDFALFHNTTGGNNIGIGGSGGANLTTGSNNIDIGNAGVANESNRIRIGTKGTQAATFIAGISGVAVTGSQVVVNSNGKLGVAASSARFKESIKPMDNASETILALQPVTFRYKHEIDPDGIPQFGLVAEQVAKVNSDLVARDDQGKPFTVRYDAVNAMLLNEFIKEHRKIQQQDATIARLRSAVAEQKNGLQSAIARQQEEIKTLTVTIKEQAAQVQKASAQFEMNKPAPRVVANDQ